MPHRLDHLVRFYQILDALERGIGGRRRLAECHGRMGWPRRGVYFFMEAGEERLDTGEGLRIVRVGTHALTAHSRTALWDRLVQHRGQAQSGGGNHRGSIFRLLVGSALLNAGGITCPTWASGSSAPRVARISEHAAEREVSRIIGDMPFLWLEIDDPPGRASRRGYIERHSIALLSNLRKPTVDPPSMRWRGRSCDRGDALVRDGGLWNQKHVDEAYDPTFLDVLEGLVRQMQDEHRHPARNT